MKHLVATILSCVIFTLAFQASAQTGEINYGSDVGDYAHDDECDDPRFVGPGATADVDWDSTGRDATDCKNAVEAGEARFWFDPLNLELVQCDKVDFGNDRSADAKDGACDDPRFLTFNSVGLNLPEDVKRDASDCRHACEFGLLYNRPGN